MLAARFLFLANVFNVRICFVVHHWRFNFFGILFSPIATDDICSCVFL